MLHDLKKPTTSNFYKAAFHRIDLEAPAWGPEYSNLNEGMINSETHAPKKKLGLGGIS